MNAEHFPFNYTRRRGGARGEQRTGMRGHGDAWSSRRKGTEQKGAEVSLRCLLSEAEAMGANPSTQELPIRDTGAGDLRLPWADSQGEGRVRLFAMSISTEQGSSPSSTAMQGPSGVSQSPLVSIKYLQLCPHRTDTLPWRWTMEITPTHVKSARGSDPNPSLPSLWILQPSIPLHHHAQLLTPESDPRPKHSAQRCLRVTVSHSSIYSKPYSFLPGS